MIRKGLILLVLGFVMMFLAGCNEIEDMLGKVNQLLDQQLETTSESSDETTVEADEVENEASNSADSSEEETVDPPNTEEESDGHEDEADDGQLASFEERLQQAGLTAIDRPNGLMFPLPLDWVMVQVIKEEPWEAVFCFDTPLEETIVEVEDDFRAIGMDVISDPITVDSAKELLGK